MDVTLEATIRAAADADTVEVARAKAQLKVALLSALETPGGRIERNARQILAWGRVIPASEVIAKVDAVTVDHVRAAGKRLLSGAPTLAAIGPIKKLPGLDRIAATLRAA
jgi:predicted Zn-dependent peptidase